MSFIGIELYWCLSLPINEGVIPEKFIYRVRVSIYPVYNIRYTDHFDKRNVRKFVAAPTPRLGRLVTFNQRWQSNLLPFDILSSNGFSEFNIIPLLILFSPTFFLYFPLLLYTSTVLLLYNLIIRQTQRSSVTFARIGGGNNVKLHSVS